MNEDLITYLLGGAGLIIIVLFLLIQRRKKPAQVPRIQTEPHEAAVQQPEASLISSYYPVKIKSKKEDWKWYRLTLAGNTGSVSLRKEWWIDTLLKTGAAIKYISDSEIRILTNIDPTGLDNLVTKNLISRWEKIS